MSNEEKRVEEEIGERKSILEPYIPEQETESGWLRRMIAKLEAMKLKKEKAEKERAWFLTDDGKKWLVNEKERLEAEKRANARMEAAYAEKILECKRQIALTILADELVKKYGIKDSDARIPRIMTELEDLRHAVAATYRG